MSHLHPRPVIVLGEALIDLYASPRSHTLAEAPHLFPTLGGAPANLSVQLALLGAPAALVTTLGEDPMSERALRVLRAAGVDTALVRRRRDVKIGLTLVELDDRGERTFHPWRENAADQWLEEADLDEDALAGASLFAHGTVSLRTEPSRSATLRAIAVCRERGVKVAVDVNVRPRMFQDPALMLELVRGVVRTADVVKATREEAALLLGPGPDEELAARLLEQGPGLALLTLGGEGAYLLSRAGRARVPSCPVDLVDATGAGDAFLGAALAALAHHGQEPGSLDDEALTLLGRYACRAGAAVCGTLGATPGMLDAARCPLPSLG